MSLKTPKSWVDIAEEEDVEEKRKPIDVLLEMKCEIEQLRNSLAKTQAQLVKSELRFDKLIDKINEIAPTCNMCAGKGMVPTDEWIDDTHQIWEECVNCKGCGKILVGLDDQYDV
jgi:DnaJ-class molecular chaperone